MTGATRFRILDALIIALVAGLALASGIGIYANRGARATLVVETRDGKYLYDLETDRDIAVSGPLGETHIHIEGGEARFHDSPCPNKTCVAAPPVSKVGDWGACLPNEVMMRVEGAPETDEIDIIAR